MRGVFTSRIEHVGTSRPPNRIAICVHLQQILTTAPTAGLVPLVRIRGTGLRVLGRCRPKLVNDALESILSVEVNPHVLVAYVEWREGLIRRERSDQQGAIRTHLPCPRA